jgi:hypothetical protein
VRQDFAILDQDGTIAFPANVKGVLLRMAPDCLEAPCGPRVLASLVLE